MTETLNKAFCLYKIYSENCLLYIGSTKDSLQKRLHNHFFKKPMYQAINIECVTKIEYAHLPTEADMMVYEVYYINQLKPPLNWNKKTEDKLTIHLLDIPFQELFCPHMDKWKEQILAANRDDKERHHRKIQIEMERREKRREIYSRQDLSYAEKNRQYCNWLVQFYEPARNGL